MTRRITILQGHPDPAGHHLLHAMADAYAEGAIAAGHEVSRIEVARLEFPLLLTQADFETGVLPPALVQGLPLPMKINVLAGSRTCAGTAHGATDSASIDVGTQSDAAVPCRSRPMFVEEITSVRVSGSNATTHTNYLCLTSSARFRRPHPALEVAHLEW